MEEVPHAAAIVFKAKVGADLLAYESAVNRDLTKPFLLLKLGGDSSVRIAA